MANTGTIRRLCSSGDSPVTYDTADPKTVERAIAELETQFAQRRAVVATAPVEEQLRSPEDFKPEVQTEIVSVPQYQGG